MKKGFKTLGTRSDRRSGFHPNTGKKLKIIPETAFPRAQIPPSVDGITTLHYGIVPVPPHPGSVPLWSSGHSICSLPGPWNPAGPAQDRPCQAELPQPGRGSQAEGPPSSLGCREAANGAVNSDWDSGHCPVETLTQRVSCLVQSAASQHCSEQLRTPTGAQQWVASTEMSPNQADLQLPGVSRMSALPD